MQSQALLLTIILVVTSLTSGSVSMGHSHSCVRPQGTRDGLPSGAPDWALHKERALSTDKRTKVARFLQPTTAVKKEPEGHIRACVSFQSTGVTNVTSANYLDLNTLFARTKLRGKGSHCQSWVTEMNNARQCYLASCGRIDTINCHIKHCQILPILWQQQTTPTDGIYFEIGANIGSCVMEMLLSTDDAKIVAFEPHPRNQFVLKSTIKRLPQELQRRVAFFPIGLGDVSTTSTIFAAKGNMGNSVVGKIIKDSGGQEFSRNGTTHDSC